MKATPLPSRILRPIAHGSRALARGGGMVVTYAGRPLLRVVDAVVFRYF